jgi:hypothetical protein
MQIMEKIWGVEYKTSKDVTLNILIMKFYRIYDLPYVEMKPATPIPYMSSILVAQRDFLAVRACSMLRQV